MTDPGAVETSASRLARLRELVTEALEIEAEHPGVEWAEESLDSFAAPVAALIAVAEAASQVLYEVTDHDGTFTVRAPHFDTVKSLAVALARLDGEAEGAETGGAE